MADNNKQSVRDTVEQVVGQLRATAKDTVIDARARLGGALEQAVSTTRSHAADAAAIGRDRAADLAALGRDRAADLAASTTQQARKLGQKSRKAADRAALASRDLVSDRPLTAVLIGIAAGAVIGAVANHLLSRQPEAEDDGDDFESDIAGA